LPPVPTASALDSNLIPRHQSPSGQEKGTGYFSSGVRGRPGLLSVDFRPSADAMVACQSAVPNGVAGLSVCIRYARNDSAQVIGLFTNELMSTAQQIDESVGFRRENEIPSRLGWRYKLQLTEPMV